MSHLQWVVEVELFLANETRYSAAWDLSDRRTFGWSRAAARGVRATIREMREKKIKGRSQIIGYSVDVQRVKP